MKLDNRRQGIMDALMETGSASVDNLSLRFSVSKMTIHRDLDELEEAGLLRKVRGGASIQNSLQFESDFRYRQKLAVTEKDRIARAAAALIEPGQTIIIDDSSTTGAIAGHIEAIRPLTIITNNLVVIEKLAGMAGITLIALGGQYSKKFNGFFGLVAGEALASLRADVAFLSSSAIHGASAFHQDQEVVQIKRLMMQAAERSYLMVDHSKFGRSALHYFAALTSFDGILTSALPDIPIQKTLDDAGISVSVVQS